MHVAIHETGSGGIATCTAVFQEFPVRARARARARARCCGRSFLCLEVVGVRFFVLLTPAAQPRARTWALLLRARARAHARARARAAADGPSCAWKLMAFRHCWQHCPTASDASGTPHSVGTSAAPVCVAGLQGNTRLVTGTSGKGFRRNPTFLSRGL